MMLKVTAAAALFANMLLLSALPPGISVDESGVLTVNKINAAVAFYGKDWKLTPQNGKSVKPDPSYPVPSLKIYELKGTLQIPGTDGFAIQEWVNEESPDTVYYSMTMRNLEGIAGQSLSLSFTLPVHLFADREIKINDRAVKLTPDDKGAFPVFYKVEKIELAVDDKIITLSGNFTVNIQDNRKFQVNNFSLRLQFGNGLVKDAKIEARIKVSSRADETVDLQAADQGKADAAATANIMKQAGVPEKELSVGPVKFKLPDFKNKQTGILVIAPGAAATIPVAPASQPQYLYLLHRAAGVAVKPVVTATYADGQVQTIELKAGQDFSFGQPLLRLPNAAVATTNNNSYNGSQFSQFCLTGKDLKQLSFANLGNDDWIVFGATLSDGNFPTAAVESIYFVTPQNSDYVKIENAAAAKAGTALDFSNLLDAPAGKYGWITAGRDGRFHARQAPQKRFKFYGPNLCFDAQFLDKADAEALADELARMGYTAVRFHHFDNLLADKDAKSSLDFNPAQLDKLDYLFYCLKTRGMYITIDLYCSRKFRTGEMTGAPSRDMKSLAPVYAPARENWKAYVKNLLTHVNPYTRLAWGDDPTLYAVSTINETVTNNNWSKKEVKDLYLEGYQKYLEQKGLLTPENLENRGGLFHDYLARLDIQTIAELGQYLRNDLKYQGLITDLNYMQNGVFAEIRDTFDFVDNHNYWDHPNFMPGKPWSFPVLHNQMSALKASAWNPRVIMPSRIFGKPFTVTEISYVFPNRYRAESGPLLGAYAALQDWDGLYRFAWSHTAEGSKHQSAINRFDIAEDSLSQVAERITNLLFMRNDVKPAASAVAWPFGESTFAAMTDLSSTEFPIGFQSLGFYCKVGSLRQNKTVPGVRKITDVKNFKSELTADQQQAIAAKVIVSETGEITYDTAGGDFKVLTPRTESLSVFTGKLEGNVLSVKDADSFQIVTASAMDGNNLAASGKILLFHQSDVTNERIRYSSESTNAVEHWGLHQTLIRKAQCTATLQLGDGPYRVTALRLDGTVKAVAESKIADGKLVIPLNTANFDGTMIYLIEKL